MKNLLIVFVALLVISCQQNNDFVTETGVEVSCVVKGDGSPALKDSIVLVALKIVTGDGEILTETEPDKPLGIAFDPEMEAGHLQEVLTKLEVGDSVTFSTTVYNLFVETYKTQIPAEMDSAGLVVINMKFSEMMSKESYQEYINQMRAKMQEDNALMMEAKAVSDIEEIDAYLVSNSITAQSTESGLFYEITQEGTGVYPEAGDEVTVKYAGRLLSGEPFDSGEFSFPVGTGRVIQGWDEGIPLIREGGKGVLYIPSILGYGSRQSGPVIKPFSILVFDVEVLKVEKK
jgi:FKBP-type peptidyl-prolyl cis-trans isomerase FkpA